VSRNNESESLICSGWEDIYLNLKELFISSFRWENLPDGINQRYLELSLFENNHVAFFYDDVMEKYLVLKSMVQGDLDVYYEPKKIKVIGGNGYQRLLTNHKDAVLIYNNYIRSSPQLRIMDYAKRIYWIERTIDVNINQQKTPFIVKGSRKNQQTLQNFFQQFDDFKMQIFIDDLVDENKITATALNVPYVADKLQEQKKKLWNEVLSFIGIENNNSEKNERLVADEVMVSNGLAIANRNSKLQARNDAVKEINKMFNLNISVDINNLSVLDAGRGDGIIE